MHVSPTTPEGKTLQSPQMGTAPGDRNGDTGPMTRRDEPANSWPLEKSQGLALLVRITREIDDVTDDGRDFLLEDLLCAAWPSSAAQNQ